MTLLERLREETNPAGIAFLLALVFSLMLAWLGVYSATSFWPVVALASAWLILAEIFGRVWRVPDLEEEKRLSEALIRVLEWPLPQGTVENYALPPWLAKEAREALAAQQRKDEGG